MRRIRDVEKLGSRLEGMAVDLGLIQKNWRAQHYDFVVFCELIGEQCRVQMAFPTRETSGPDGRASRIDRGARMNSDLEYRSST